MQPRCPRCGARLAPAWSGLRCPRLSACGRGGYTERGGQVTASTEWTRPLEPVEA